MGKRLSKEDHRAIETGDDWREFGELLGWTLYGWTFEYHATFMVPGMRDLHRVPNAVRESILAAMASRSD